MSNRPLHTPHLPPLARHRGKLFTALVIGLALALIVLPGAVARWFFAVLIGGALVIFCWLYVWKWLRAGYGRVAAWPLARRAPVGLTFAWLSLALTIGAAVLFQPGAQEHDVARGLELWLISGIMLGLAFWLRPVALPRFLQQRDMTPAAVDAAPVRWPVVAVGGAALLLLAAVHAVPLPISYHLQFLLLVTGCVSLAAGFAARSSSAPTRVNWLLVGVTLLAFALNTSGLEDRVHIWIDEYHFAEMVTYLWNDPERLLLVPNTGTAAFSLVYAYLQSLSIHIFGAELTALRMVSVAFGTLTVPALYLLGRELFDKRTALLAALFLAAFPPQIHISRLGLNNIADPLFGVLALVFLIRGLRGGRCGDYAISGVMLGLTQYFYEGGRLLYPALVITWLALLLLLWRPRGARGGLVVMALAALLVAFPVYAAAYGSAAPALPRFEDTSILEHYFTPWGESGFVTFMRVHYLRPLLHFVQMPDTSEFFYGGHTGMLLGYVAPLFMLGVVIALWRLRLVGALLLLWLAAVIFGNSLIGYWVYTVRFAVAFPAVALLVAVGIHYALPALLPAAASFRLRQQERLRHWLMPLAALLLVLPQVAYYYGAHLDTYNLQVRPGMDHADAVYRARDLPPDTWLYLLYQEDDYVYPWHLSVLYSFWKMPQPMMAYLADDDAYEMLLSLPRTADLAFFVVPDDRETIGALYRAFGPLPMPQYSSYNLPPDRQYALYYIPARER